AAAVAVVAATALVGQVQPKLRAQRPLDHGLLEALEHGLNPGRIHRAGNQLLEKILRDINGRRHHRCLLLAWHTCSLAASWYASHTKFLTRSFCGSCFSKPVISLDFAAVDGSRYGI